MTLTSPIAALFWEAWQLTYRRFFFRVTAAIVACALIMVYVELPNLATTIILLAAVIQGAFPAVSANSMEDQGGFPFYLGYVRPVPTWLLVGFPMVYFGVLCALSYIIPALVIDQLYYFYPPLLSTAATIFTIAMVFTALQWWTSNRSLRFAGWQVVVALFFAWIFWLERTSEPGEDFVYGPATYGALFLIVMAALILAIWGTNRQRHNEETTFRARKAGAFMATLLEGDWTGALGSVTRALGISCPTSSPVKAEVWRVFTRHASIMLLLSLLSALIVLAIWFFTDYQELPMLGMIVGLAVTLLIHLAFRDVYGVRKKQGHAFLNTFDATLAIGSGQLIAVRVLVSVVSFFCSIFLFCAVVWVFSPFASENAAALRQGVSAFFRFQSMDQFMGWTTIGFTQLVAAGVCLSTVAVFFSLARKPIRPRHLAFFGAYLVALAVSAYVLNEEGNIQVTIARVLILHLWLFAAYLVVATSRLFGLVVSDRILSPKVLAIGTVIWLAYALLFFLLVRSSLEREGVVLIQMTTTRAMLLGMFCLLPLTAFVLAPWAYGRVRHQ